MVKPRNAPDERLTRGDDTASEKSFRSDMKDAINNIRRKGDRHERASGISTKPALKADGVVANRSNERFDAQCPKVGCVGRHRQVALSIIYRATVQHEFQPGLGSDKR